MLLAQQAPHTCSGEQGIPRVTPRQGQSPGCSARGGLHLPAHLRALPASRALFCSIKLHQMEGKIYFDKLSRSAKARWGKSAALSKTPGSSSGSQLLPAPPSSPGLGHTGRAPGIVQGVLPVPDAGMSEPAQAELQPPWRDVQARTPARALP